MSPLVFSITKPRTFGATGNSIFYNDVNVPNSLGQGAWTTTAWGTGAFRFRYCSLRMGNLLSSYGNTSFWGFETWLCNSNYLMGEGIVTHAATSTNDQLMVTIGGYSEFYVDVGNSRARFKNINLRDYNWHHIGVKLNRNTGGVQLFIDGIDRGTIYLSMPFAFHFTDLRLQQTSIRDRTHGLTCYYNHDDWNPVTRFNQTPTQLPSNSIGYLAFTEGVGTTTALRS